MTKLKMLNAKEVIQKYELYPQGKTQLFWDNQLLMVSDPYTPFRTGALKNTVYTTGGELKYIMPYARRMWYGDNFNFNGAPMRGSRWVQRAYQDNEAQLIQSLENYIRSGNYAK